MLQAIKETVRCSRCGCIALPDASRCPRCGAVYHEDKTIRLSDTMDDTALESIHRTREPDCIKVVRANYQLDCPYHGKVYIKAAVISPSMRCPFC